MGREISASYAAPARAVGYVPSTSYVAPAAGQATALSTGGGATASGVACASCSGPHDDHEAALASARTNLSQSLGGYASHRPDGAARGGANGGASSSAAARGLLTDLRF
jgi:hypothetical protein